MPNTKLRTRPAAAIALATLAFATTLPLGSAHAAEPVRLTLKDHLFVPPQAAAPAGERFRIEITNTDSTPAEFESADLRAEKIVVPGGTVSLMAGPLKPGTYIFFDDYHPDTAKGTLTVAPAPAN